MRHKLLLLLLIASRVAAQEVNYSPKFFGPNALPVAEHAVAIIPQTTTVALSGNYFFGFGDRTVNPHILIEVPLLPSRVSLKVWAALWEHYRVSEETYRQRQMSESELAGTTSGGDIYVQTRISILRESRTRPAVVLNSTLRSASGGEFEARRHFDTPGYSFDLEAAKSFPFNSQFIDEMRLSFDAGFLCWETTGSVQNDAFMYGGAIVLTHRAVELQAGAAGYAGWMKNGDKPFVINGKLTGNLNRFAIFLQYKYGIRDWDYHQLQAGVIVSLPKLTPKYRD
jgi:hypothetical protein